MLPLPLYRPLAAEVCTMARNIFNVENVIGVVLSFLKACASHGLTLAMGLQHKFVAK